jgi:hypothetical protein
MNCLERIVILWSALIVSCLKRCSGRFKKRLICFEGVVAMIDSFLGLGKLSLRVIDPRETVKKRGLIEKAEIP